MITYACKQVGKFAILEQKIEGTVIAKGETIPVCGYVDVTIASPIEKGYLYSYYNCPYV